MITTVVNRILLVLAYAGVFVAGVLSLAALLQKDVPCGGSGGCEAVAADPSAHLLGPSLPNAYIGFFGYLLLAALATYRELAGNGGPKARFTINLGYIVAAIGTMVSIYLTFISITEIHATCKWCLSSAVIMTATLFGYMLLALKADSAPVGPSRGLTGFVLVPLLAILAVGGIGAEATNFTASRVKLYQHSDQDDSVLIAKGAHVKNPEGYTVTLVEFGDLDCPTCKKEYPQIQQLVARSNGRLRWVFHNFPLWTNKDHTGALTAAVIDEMAAEKGKFWDYLDTVYGNGVSDPNAPLPGPDDMLNFGEHVGLSRAEMKKRLLDKNDPAVLKVQNDLELARIYKVNNTPSFIIMAAGKPNAQVVGSDMFNVISAEPYKTLLKGM